MDSSGIRGKRATTPRGFVPRRELFTGPSHMSVEKGRKAGLIPGPRREGQHRLCGLFLARREATTVQFKKLRCRRQTLYACCHRQKGKCPGRRVPHVSRFSRRGTVPYAGNRGTYISSVTRGHRPGLFRLRIHLFNLLSVALRYYLAAQFHAGSKRPILGGKFICHE